MLLCISGGFELPCCSMGSSSWLVSFDEVLIDSYSQTFSWRVFLFMILIIHISARILNWGEDRRFDEMRANLGKLAVFWIFQVCLTHIDIYT